MKILTINGYDFWKVDNLYGVTKEGGTQPFCGYAYLHVLLKHKGI